MGTMKNHPNIPHLKISPNGEFTFKGKPLEVKEHNSPGKILQTVTIKSTVRSASKLVLETYAPKPMDGHRYYAAQKHGNKLNVDNLFWYPARILTSKQAQKVWKLKTLQKETLSSIANYFGVCDMTIYRTLKRMKNKTSTL